MIVFSLLNLFVKKGLKHWFKSFWIAYIMWSVVMQAISLKKKEMMLDESELIYVRRKLQYIF